MTEFLPPILWAVSLAAVVAAVLLSWRERRRAGRLQVSLDAAQGRLDEVGQVDALTGLMTRPAFDERLAGMAMRADRDRSGLCLVYLGLDGLRLVNQAQGHGAGDKVLREVARRLRRAAGDAAVLARVGGDEFVLVHPGRIDSARAVADVLLTTFTPRFELGSDRIQLTASVGIAAYPEHGAWSRLMSHAESAMRVVKRAGGAARSEYDPAIAEDVRAQAELARDLRLAIERGELMLYYQPKLEAATIKITAAEALLRWRHPVLGLVSPGVFIPVAERHGLIGAIGDWVVDEATRQAGVWKEHGLRMRVAINVSAYQMRQDDFVDRLERALLRHALPPSRFTCEITESVAMEDTAATVRAFERMGRMGLHVSIDDFGTGHSSLASLRRLPAGELKIDRAFVTDLATSEDARSIARAIVQMAHTLGLRVVAEGVETAEQSEQLVAMGCDELQGFLYAKPMPAHMLELWAMDDDGPAPLQFRESLFIETQPASLN